MKRTDITEIFPDATKEQIDRIMDLNGGDINRVKADLESVRGQLATAQSEIETLKNAPNPDSAKLAEVTAELNGLKQANSLRDLREKVSKETGVPASLLTAETEDDCKAQAEAIKAYAQPAGYPKIRDGGEVGTPPASGTRDQFANWFNEVLKN